MIKQEIENYPDKYLPDYDQIIHFLQSADVIKGKKISTDEYNKTNSEMTTETQTNSDSFSP